MKIDRINLNNIVNFNKKREDRKENSIGHSNSDDVKISSEGKKLHKLALQSNELLSTIEDIKKDELSQIKERVDSGFYKKQEVIDSIASSLLEDDEFQDIFMKDEYTEVVKDYIDTRESDIELVDKSKQKVADKAYHNKEVYEKVADDIIDIYT